MTEVIIYDYADIIGLFSRGAVGGLFFGSSFFLIGFVINFLLSLISDRIN